MKEIGSFFASFIDFELRLTAILISIFSGMIVLSNYIYIFVVKKSISYLKMISVIKDFSAFEIILAILLCYFIGRIMYACSTLLLRRKSKNLTRRDYLLILEGLTQKHRKLIKDYLDSVNLNVFFHLSLCSSFIINSIFNLYFYLRKMRLLDLIIGLLFMLFSALFYIGWRRTAKAYDDIMTSIKNITESELMDLC